MQIDWSPYNVLIAGCLVTVHAFGCLLCSSRKLFVHFFRNERQSTLLEGLAMAFEYFGGCAIKVVLDNMATAVVARYGPDGQPIWQPAFAEFAAHYGFKPFACRIRHSDRKGKKEKSFRLVEDDHLKGSEFESFDDLNQRTRIWLDETPDAANLRVHGTTKRVPNEAFLSERDLLIRLPDKRFPVYERSVRVVDSDSTLSVHGTRYSVPDPLANRSVEVRLFAEHFEVINQLGRVAFSRRYVADSEKGIPVIDSTHYASVPRRPRGGHERLDQAFLKRYPSLGQLASGLLLKMKSLAPVHIRALLRLANHYGDEAFLAAATRAQQYRRFDSKAVGRILEQQHGPAEDPPVAPLGGWGPIIVGDVEPGSLDAYEHLDAEPPEGLDSSDTEPAEDSEDTTEQTDDRPEEED